MRAIFKSLEAAIEEDKEWGIRHEYEEAYRENPNKEYDVIPSEATFHGQVQVRLASNRNILTKDHLIFLD